MAKKDKILKSEPQYHHGDLAVALVDAGLQLLKEKGVEGVGLRAVASAAGVSHSAPYRHFKNKTALLAAIALRGFGQLTKAIEEVMGRWPDDPKQQLIESGRSYVKLAIRNPEMTQLMFGGLLKPESLSEDYCDQSQKSFQALLQVLENGCQLNLYKSAESVQRALAVWSMVHGLAMLASAGQLGSDMTEQVLVESVTEYISSVILNGILR